MAGLTGKTIAATYHSILKVSTSDNQNVDTTLRDIVDGEDTASCLKLATDKATFTLGTDAGDDFKISDGSSTLLKVEGDSKDVTIETGDLIITAAAKGIIHTNSGTVTQGTSITTGVTLSTTSGVITMYATAIAADENIEFTVTNTTVQADSVILLTMQDENTVDNTQLVCATHTIAGGSFKITVANTDSAQASSATANKIHFLVINNSV